MSTYAIGDLQGCFVTLQSLLRKVDFNPRTDRLWLVGDLVNRGPDSLACLRFVQGLGDAAVTVLGNHDLHLLAIASGLGKPGPMDTLQAILEAPDRDPLLDWLRSRKLLHIEGDYAMVHAGLLPSWTWQQAADLAAEVEESLRGNQYRQLLANMYGNEPVRWQEQLAESDRKRIVINAMTRMRALGEDGRMDLKFKGGPGTMPAGLRPWFEAATSRSTARIVIAGHWSALGLFRAKSFVGLDSGCVWGRELSAFRLEDQVIFQVPCAEQNLPADQD
jgi:bis(5'-nucleosyl)-tetraphosphatase (symmetrical)